MIVVGFRSGHRHAAAGARELATSFAVEGLREVEVCDDRGNLRTFADLADENHDHGTDQRAVAERPSALT